MKENWGRDPYPPVYYDVLDRRIEGKPEESHEETVWVRGHHVHLGETIQGYSGPETVVRRRVFKDGQFRLLK